MPRKLRKILHYAARVFISALSWVILTVISLLTVAAFHPSEDAIELNTVAPFFISFAIAVGIFFLSKKPLNSSKFFYDPEILLNDYNDNRTVVPTPTISQSKLQYVESLWSQLNDCLRLVNTTTKPDIFFKRLHFMLDLLLELQQYEQYNLFKNSTPTSDYQKVMRELEDIVNSFIDRAVDVNNQKLASLKTQAARNRHREDFAIKLISAFDCAHTFWSGNRSQTRIFPHYTGPLFTPQNYQRVQAIYDSLDDI